MSDVYKSVEDACKSLEDAYKSLLNAYNKLTDVHKSLSEMSKLNDDVAKENISQHVFSPVERVKRGSYETTQQKSRILNCRNGNLAAVPTNRKTKSHSECYFLLFNEGPRENFSERKRHHLQKLSQERCEAINTTSMRRAAIAANRRAVVMDLLRGKRLLDEDLLDVLKTDSSQISSFNDKFMRQMKISSKSVFDQTVNKPKKVERQKALEYATNQILAHSCSASASKAIAKYRSYYS